MNRVHAPLLLSLAAIAILGERDWLRTGRGYGGRAALTTFGIVAGNVIGGTPRLLVLGGIYGAVWALAPRLSTPEGVGRTTQSSSRFENRLRC